MNDTQKQDLDETRRLCYMALLVKRTGKYELAGTLAHSLIHHVGIGLEPDEVMERVVRIVNGDGTAADAQWLGDTAQILTADLNPKKYDPLSGIPGARSRSEIEQARAEYISNRGWEKTPGSE